MTHAEKRLMVETAARVQRLEARLDAMCKIFEILLERKAGRPTQAQASELEQLRGQANGAAH